MRKRGKRSLPLILTAAGIIILAYLAVCYVGAGIFSDGGKAAVPQKATESGVPAGNNSCPDISLPSETGEGQSDSSNSLDSDSDRTIEEQLRNMSMEEKIGQLVIVGADGYENNEHSRRLIENYHVGGFILFKRNIKDSNQMLSLLNSLKETNKANKLPLFLSIDEEGGRISRMPDEFLKIPSNRIIGEKNDSSLSYRIGNIIGEELKMFGFNMDFAPVLDINSNPQNPVIGDRAFGSEAGIVTELGIQTMKGIQAQNIISVVKHFPGHGDTSEDSHVGLPRVNNDLERLYNFELVPFSAAIENRADAVMIAHILLPEIDAENPASLSKTIISDVLRSSMHFDGVVITDDFTMGAIEKNYDIGRAAVKSIQAGSDIVLVCHTFAKQETVIRAIKSAVSANEISMERIDESVYRIIKLKNKYSLSADAVKKADSKVINEKIKNLFN
ncbi:beta-N-acetylhexosaminidase [Ruminiclostridium sufflavum DSM 19573]|uniref:Beta-N-acetylhexosaminidase n=1 Tax=Ruminiclostridium sufflavum DSM 19573 TaxID=1121337 RepID=A0A318XNG3_9FIRM|nr:beta-N-acetylhexosaminidase [Ruminiclostridium sufflavum]PYG89567.1 beta-N-acetylhexosaminidase [Ruminiclostridium sufflavum DSM 19573]